MQMDICSHIGFSINDNNSLHGFCMHTLDSTYGVVGVSVDELAYGAIKFLNIQDDEDGVLGYIPPHEKGVFHLKDKCGEAHQSEIITEDHEKLFSKCATFPCSSNTLSSAAASVGGSLKGGMNDGADAVTSEVLTHAAAAATTKSVNPHFSSAPSLPNPLKPVSAMKGSREKRGATPPEKLTVTWAPDVYDPVPTSALHVVTNRPRKHGKKKSKGKQKSGSKSSGGSKGKEKKQGRKRGGSSCDMGCRHEEGIILSEMKPSAIDFHLGIPDLFCGVNRYGSSLHLSSVVEASLAFHNDTGTYPFREQYDPMSFVGFETRKEA